jgi:hypothetical protein
MTLNVFEIKQREARQPTRMLRKNEILEMNLKR